jgi:serine/threonine protein kinase
MHGSYSGEGTRLGPYRIIRRLGIGGTSEVLLAVSQGPYGFERTVVIKRLLPKCEWDPAQARMLAAEAVAYARLTHPAILRLYDFFAPDGHVALVLEFVDGPSLARLRAMLRTERESLGDPAALFIASRVFGALAAAHAARDPRTGEFAPVIHRDVSPGNVLIPWDGFVKLGDFGLAKVTGLSGDTRSGTLKGTYGYMAPEQVLGERVTPRTDVYAGCLLLRELLLSRPTFTQGKMPELEFLRTMADPQLAPVEDLRGGISRTLAHALRCGLEVEPDRRTLTAAEMVTILRGEVDLDRAHASLVERLARVRPPEPRAATPIEGIAVVGAGATSPMSTTVRFNRFGIPSLAPEPEDLETRPAAVFDTPETMTLSTKPGRLMTMWPAELRNRSGLVLATALIGAAAAVGAAILFKGGETRKAAKPNVTIATATANANARAPVNAPPNAPSNAPASAPANAPKVSASVNAVASASPVPNANAPKTIAPIAPAPASSAASASAKAPLAVNPASRAPPSAATTGDIVTPAIAHQHRVFLDDQFAAAHSGETLHVPCGKHVIRIGSRGAKQSIDVPCGGLVRVDTK